MKSQVHRARRKLSQQVRRIQEARALANLTGGNPVLGRSRTVDRQKSKPSQADIGVNNPGAPENNDSDVTRTSAIDFRWERTRRDEERSQVKGVRGNQNRSRVIGYSPSGSDKDAAERSKRHSECGSESESGCGSQAPAARGGRRESGQCPFREATIMSNDLVTHQTQNSPQDEIALRAYHLWGRARQPNRVTGRGLLPRRRRHTA